MKRFMHRDLKNITFFENWLNKSLADNILSELLQLPWQEEYIKMFGKLVKVPRKVIWVGDKGATYTYSNVKHTPLPWPECLKIIRQKLNVDLKCDFNSALLNLYENGTQYMGWHSDNEAELGPDPCIASISFGASRRFLIRSKTTIHKYEYLLSHGSLLVMRGDIQDNFNHCLPKMLKVKEKRINVTFRKVQTLLN